MNRKSFLLSLGGGAAALSLAETACQSRTPDKPATTASPAEQFAARVMEDTAIACSAALAYIGDRFGIFRAMASSGAVTADQLAAKVSLNPRYVLEWLRAMAASRYIDYRPSDQTFVLSPDHASVLADEDSPVFMGGWLQSTVPALSMVPKLLEAFRTGKGVAYDQYPAEYSESIERSTRPDYQHRLVPVWLAALPAVVEKLRAGGSTADLGCGGGIASIAIGRAFPKARVSGFDPDGPSIEKARANARNAGLADRIRFEVFDGLRPPGGPYDLITIFLALHHARDPVALVRSAREALAPGGVLFVGESRVEPRLEENFDPNGRYVYSISVLDCLSTGLAAGAPGYGTGITEADVHKIAQDAGFREFRRLLPKDPYWGLYALSG